MSVFRLILMEEKNARSGVIPSGSISLVLLALSRGASNISSFWKTISEFDPYLLDYFLENEDKFPLLEGKGDGLLVINWEHKCIESFQEYQPVLYSGEAIPHNGQFALETERIPYKLSHDWHIIDHFFEEKN